MKAFQYIRYFFYLAHNWTLRIAFHLIKEEMEGEKKYGIDTTGADELTAMEKQGIDISHATMYMPASYGLLNDFFQQIKATHLVDMGCGKGRTLCVAAHHGIHKLSGIDFNGALCRSAEINLAHTKKLVPQIHFKIVHNDAFYYDIPDDADCIFLFNPFDEVIMSGVVNNIMESINRKPRVISVIYFNPLHKELFTKEKFTQVYHARKLQYLEGVILKSPAIK